MKDSRICRREFLRGWAAAGAGWLVLDNSASARSYWANEKLDIAIVGLGGRGRGLADQVARVGENLVALCDVDRRRAASWLERTPNMPCYDDFRVMLDKLDGRIDAVAAALPHHAHASVAAAAMQRGKHVFIEKPMAHSVAEARALRRIARRQKVATQMGNQGIATNSFRRTVERVWEGAIGDVREAHVWFVFGGPGPREAPTDAQPVPDHLNWDVWLGPAPLRPYHRAWMGASATSQCSKWREFSAASLGGSGTHGMNVAFRSLRLGELWDETGPGGGTIRIEAEVSEFINVSYPHWEKVRYDIPPRGALPAASLYWYNAPVAELRRQGVWQRLEEIAGRPPVWEGS